MAHKGVARLALDMIIKAGVSLMLHVKMSIVSSLARCTGADIFRTIEELSLKSQLGRCERFHLKTLRNNKVVSFFEGCKPRSQATIILHGASKELLKKVTSVVKMLCYAAYNGELEAALLHDHSMKVNSSKFIEVLEAKAKSPPLRFQESQLSKSGSAFEVVDEFQSYKSTSTEESDPNSDQCAQFNCLLLSHVCSNKACGH